MSQHRPVPRLDLAPKLKRPLSLWNPLDYLRLLYWVLYFPQALRWYMDTFGGGYIPEPERSWRKEWELLHQNPIKRQFLLQGIVLVAITQLALSVILQEIGVSLHLYDVLWKIALVLTLSIVVTRTASVTDGVAVSVDLSIVLGLLSGLATSAKSSVLGELASSGVIGISAGLIAGFIIGMRSSLGGDIGLSFAYRLGFFVMHWLFIGALFILALFLQLFAPHILASSLVDVVARFITLLMALCTSFSIMILRPENWLYGSLFTLMKPRNGCWQIPHITPLPLFTIFSQLKNWLRQDWETALHNSNQLLTYSLQFIRVINAINYVLAETPLEQVIFRVAQLAEAPYDWNMVRFASTSLRAELKLSGVEGFSSFFFFSRRWRQVIQARFVRDTHLQINTPARAAAAGFYCLHEKAPAQAMKAFTVVRPLLYGEEMFTIAQTLAAFHEAKEPATIAALQISASPSEPLLRPTTWQAITSLSRVVEDVRLVQRSLSKSTRSFALNRALGELKTTLNNSDSLPNAERDLLVTIAKTWQEALLNVAGEVGEISITKPVTNPYVVGDPVEGNLFVGREDVLRQLEELWVMGHQLQSVILYGHRRMGKTSILRNVANCLGAEVKIAYINLLNMGATSQGVGEVLMAITDAISDAVGCTPPDDADLLNLPYRTFERYLKQVEAQLNGGLIVALDEFEKIEELIEAEKIPKDFMGYLRGLVQMSSKVAFAFAGLHTLEEMTADYFQPFFASVIPIHVGFLQPGATCQILANPDEDFPLDYTPEALDQIYALTAGQPYLVQLVGFQLVRRYNDYVFEQGRSRNPVFTVEDVEGVINDPEFFKRGRYYFDGVWGQAARGASGQPGILKALAPHLEGLSIEELRTQLDEIVRAQGVALLQEETLQEALKTLTRHDVVQEYEGSWRIIVELFRRWVLQS